MLRDTTNDQVPDIGFRQVTERNPFKCHHLLLGSKNPYCPAALSLFLAERVRQLFDIQ